MAGKRKVIKTIIGKNSCLEVISHAISRDGYPSISKNGKNQNMHRVLYEEHYGEIEKGFEIRHTCDNRLCINLDHLLIGTHKDNMQDCKKRKRFNPILGEKRKQAKLTNEQVYFVRNSTFTNIELAKILNVDRSTINKIRLKRTWRHLL